MLVGKKEDGLEEGGKWKDRLRSQNVSKREKERGREIINFLATLKMKKKERWKVPLKRRRRKEEY